MLSAVALAGPVDGVISMDLAVRDSNGAATVVTLHCAPPGGNHPHPSRACETLRSVNGNFEDLPHEQIMCPAIYAPVTVSATGHWYKRPIEFEREFPNRCSANAGTASVFDFHS